MVANLFQACVRPRKFGQLEFLLVFLAIEMVIYLLYHQKISLKSPLQQRKEKDRAIQIIS